MMAGITSIYSIPEGEAWARGQDYAGYVDYHTRMGCVARKLTEAGYRDFCILMDKEMEGDFRAWLEN